MQARLTPGPARRGSVFFRSRSNQRGRDDVGAAECDGFGNRRTLTGRVSGPRRVRGPAPPRRGSSGHRLQDRRKPSTPSSRGDCGLSRFFGRAPRWAPGIEAAPESPRRCRDNRRGGGSRRRPGRRSKSFAFCGRLGEQQAWTLRRQAGQPPSGFVFAALVVSRPPDVEGRFAGIGDGDKPLQAVPKKAPGASRPPNRPGRGSGEGRSAAACWSRSSRSAAATWRPRQSSRHTREIIVLLIGGKAPGFVEVRAGGHFFFCGRDSSVCEQPGAIGGPGFEGAKRRFARRPRLRCRRRGRPRAGRVQRFDRVEYAPRRPFPGTAAPTRRPGAFAARAGRVPPAAHSHRRRPSGHRRGPRGDYKRSCVYSGQGKAGPTPESPGFERARTVASEGVLSSGGSTLGSGGAAPRLAVGRLNPPGWPRRAAAGKYGRWSSGRPAAKAQSIRRSVTLRSSSREREPGNGVAAIRKPGCRWGVGFVHVSAPCTRASVETHGAVWFSLA